MQANKLFDSLSAGYDKLFTNSPSGKLQRDIVRRQLRRRITPGMKVLEIGCGTGEDAFFMAGEGCRVTATDSSSGMIEQCRKKSRKRNQLSNPEFLQLAFNELGIPGKNQSYDLVFSNFSGLNFLDIPEIKEISGILYDLLKPGGSLVLVLFGKNCLWEKFYMFFKGRFSEINRRAGRQPLMVKISNSEIPVYYYSPSEFEKTVKDEFVLISVKPVGIFLPPSYLDNFFRNKAFLLRILAFKERITANVSCLSNLADHYFIEFRRL